jgi:hypothetical protein
MCNSLGLFFLSMVLGLFACGGGRRAEARRAVESYDRALVEAYRRADVAPVDSLVGPSEGRKIAGLIGVRRDQGLALDAELLSLELTGVETTPDALRVRTRERWRYRDRALATGEALGEESEDSYELLYVLRREKAAWLVEEVRFTAPPVVSRKTRAWGLSATAAHGAPVSPDAAGR